MLATLCEESVAASAGAGGTFTLNYSRSLHADATCLETPSTKASRAVASSNFVHNETLILVRVEARKHGEWKLLIVGKLSTKRHG